MLARYMKPYFVTAVGLTMLKAVSGAAARRISLPFSQHKRPIEVGLTVLTDVGWRDTGRDDASFRLLRHLRPRCEVAQLCSSYSHSRVSERDDDACSRLAERLLWEWWQLSEDQPKQTPSLVENGIRKLSSSPQH